MFPAFSRRQCLSAFLCAALIALFAGRAYAGAIPAPTRPPNILLIVSDDQAWTDYGCMGHPVVRTPNLDRLAGQSLWFPRAYVPSSLCCPSLASLITGRYPHQHKVVCNDPPRPASMPPQDFYKSSEFREGRRRLARFLEEIPTLPRELQSRGYVSFQSGKWWQNHYSSGGFTHGMTAGDEAHSGRHGDAGLDIGRKTLQPIYDFITEARRQEHPWFVWYAPMMPHDPHTPPERLLAKYRGKTDSLPIARYWAMVEWFDETCGQLLDHLDRNGLAQDTIVVFVTDNGWITDPQTGRFAPRSKQSPYDGGLRTPMMLRWPGHIPVRRDDHTVTSLDLMPTLLHAAGVPVPAGLAGVDLLDSPAVARRRSVQGACFTHDAVDLDHPEKGLRWRWIVEGDWKLIVPNSALEPTAKIELYQIHRDPGEWRNLADQNPTRTARLRRHLDAWWPGK